MESVSRRTFLAGAGAAAALSGCADVRSIKVLLFNIPTEVTLVANQLWDFNRKKKVYPALRPLEYGDIHQSIQNGGFDVVYVDDVWMSEFAHNETIIPLNDYISYHLPEFNFDFSAKIREDMASIASQGAEHEAVTHWMIPQRADVQVLFYNKAIFNDEKVRAGYRSLSGGSELTVPDTWQEYNLVAERLSKLRYRDQPIIATVETLANPHYAFEFFACRYWASSGMPLFDSDSNPTKASFAKAGLAALSLIREVLPYAAPGSLDADHKRSIAKFRRGQCALMPQWYSFYAELSNPLDALGRNLGVVLLPGIQRGDTVERTPCLGGGSLAITRNSTRKPLAWEFVRFFTSMETAEKAAAMGLTTPRFSGYQALRDEDLASPTAVYRKSLEIARPRPRHRHFALLEKTVGDAVNIALRNDERQADRILLDAQSNCDRHFAIDPRA